MSINEKILNIQRSLEVEKTGFDIRNEYAYFKADDVANAVRGALNNHGIIHRTKITDLREDNFYDPNGRNRPRVTFQATITFVDVEDGSEFSTDVVATGMDTGGDKATRKAAVQAFKIACIDLFIITEEFGKFDSDGDKEAEPVATEPTKRQKDESAAEVYNQITAIVQDPTNPVDGATAGKMGNRIAKEQGVEEKMAKWKQEIGVVTELLAAIKRGDVE